jgi:hypothetical protein
MRLEASMAGFCRQPAVAPATFFIDLCLLPHLSRNRSWWAVRPPTHDSSANYVPERRVPARGTDQTDMHRRVKIKSVSEAVAKYKLWYIPRDQEQSSGRRLERIDHLVPHLASA